MLCLGVDFSVWSATIRTRVEGGIVMSVETLTALSVTKRDGRQVEFQKEKIQRAIEKA